MARDAIARAEIQHAPALAGTEQAQDFRELLARRIALRGTLHGKVEIVVADRRVIARLGAIPAHGLLPR